MILNDSIAQETAELLLQIKAIKLKPQDPFTWSSGMKSPIYCDNRIILSYPPIRNYIKDQMAKQVEQLYGKPDLVAGVATGAIGIGALVADTLGLPFAYVRPEAKSHGRKNQIEGVVRPNEKVVVIEDLISTGGSSLNAVSALKLQANANVKGLIAVFSYGFEKAKNSFKSEKVEYHTLSNYDILIEKAYETGYLNNKELMVLKNWRLDPQNWNIKKTT